MSGEASTNEVRRLGKPASKANKKNGKGKHKKGNREEPASCPESMIPLDDGTCVRSQ